MLTELIEVAVPLPLYGTYTYRVPRQIRDTLSIGMRVLVPFRGRQLTGFVLGPGKQTPDKVRIKPIADVLDQIPLFPASLSDFLHWVADYYIHPIGEVIRSALPGGLLAKEQPVFHLTDEGRRALSERSLDSVTQACLQRLEHKSYRLDQLLRAEGGHLTASMVNSWHKKGWVHRDIILVRQKTRTKTMRIVAALAFDRDSVRLSSQRQRIMQILQENGETPLAELKQLIPTAASLVRAMARDNQVEIKHRTVYRDPFGQPIAPDRAPALNPQQQSAVDRISRDLSKGYGAFLLAGVTGSGKTEVYLHLAKQALEKDLSVLVLVPEIALITQTERAFRARFGPVVALLHSGLSSGERYDQWLRVLRGEARIAIGARSAVFAPFERIGLVIVDEEHDDSYKQEGALRYNARDLAVVRARQDGAVAVLGSATPSIQTSHNAAIGKYRRVQLTERIDSRHLPEIQIEDLTKFREERGLRRFMTPALMQGIKTTLQRHEQVLLFLNRRGFASSLICAACGQPLRCDRCDISLTFHRRQNAYRCHHCGFSRPANATCTNCGSAKIKRLGLGTEKIEQEIQTRFPEARVARMDRDTTKRKGSILKILKSLRNQEIDILVGTQMVAKGHDYPLITLVGIVCADLSLSMPDFRAGERTFQLLAQVAGRAGRGRSPGRVILQTYNPGHFSIEAARHQDYEAFFRQEIQYRKTLGYPPFSRLIQLRISGVDADQTAAQAQRMGRYCRQLCRRHPQFAQLEILGPIEAPLARIANKYRWQLLLKGTRYKLLQKFVYSLLFDEHAPAAKRRVSVAIDVDPVFLM
ncbi:MAG: primosomal protein N' [Desulfobacteraceae bacterium]